MPRYHPKLVANAGAVRAGEARVALPPMPCPHGRQLSKCKDCGGSRICEHGRRRSRCKDCGGSSVCEHGRRRIQCKDCGGSGFCEHGRRRSRCKDCGGSGVCEHGRLRSVCKECGGGAWSTCNTSAPTAPPPVLAEAAAAAVLAPAALPPVLAVAAAAAVLAVVALPPVLADAAAAAVLADATPPAMRTGHGPSRPRVVESASRRRAAHDAAWGRRKQTCKLLYFCNSTWVSARRAKSALKTLEEPHANCENKES